MKYAVLAGRQLFSLIFIIASAGHLSPSTIAAAAAHGVPLPEILVPLSGIIALVGGLSILFGFQTRVGAWLLVLFLVPVTVMMHNFWSVSDPMAHQIEKAMFLKNIAPQWPQWDEPRICSTEEYPHDAPTARFA